MEVDLKQHEKFAMQASLHFEYCKLLLKCEDFVTGASVIKVAQETENVLGGTFIYNVYLSD